jgi:hypothetical protein
VNNPIAKRILGLILFGIGIALCFWLKSAHDTGGSIEDRAIIFAPILVLFGLTATVAPSVMIGRGEWGTAPVAMRVLSVAISLIGLAIGLWLRFVVFKEWTTVSH